MTCPDCEGRRRMFALVDGKYLVQSCFRCGVTGVIPDEMAEWIKLGALLKERRMNPYRPLWEEAKRLGVSGMDLSNAENGYVDPTPMLAREAKEQP